MESNKKGFRLSRNWELVNFCEFDKYAVKSYCAIHGVDGKLNLGDITAVDETKLKPFNMVCGGSPCQDFSVAGKQKGSVWTCRDCSHEYNPLTVHWGKRDKCPCCGSENIERTRSSLLVEYLRVVRANKPDFGMYENVKNIVGRKFRETTFKLFENELHEYGYNTYWNVLNAKDYGIPQNRERVYLIFIKKGLDNGGFVFPEGFDNGIRLKDVLEDEVDGKYYISGEKVQRFLKSLNIDSGLRNENAVKQAGNISGGNGKWKNPQTGRIYNPDGCSPTLTACSGGGHEPKIACGIDEGINGTDGNVFSEDGVCRAIKAQHRKISLAYGITVRRLTPKETFRLMGFDDSAYDAASKVVSSRQLYKQAGNSIVVDVLYYILVELYKVMPYLFNDLKLGSFFSGIGAFEAALDRLYGNINRGDFITGRINPDCSGKHALPAALKYQRTEYAKEIRKDYEAGRMKEHRCNMREYAFRMDGLCNTITTVPEDNYIAGAAMRGRYSPDGRTEQQIEVRDDELSNAITTVQKNSLVLDFEK